MSRKGYYVDGQFIPRGSEEDREARAAFRGTEGQSRTEQKQESAELQVLGEALIGLRDDALVRLPLPDRLREAVREARRIKSPGAGRRQRQFIGKLMRQQEPETLAAIAEAVRVRGRPTAASVAAEVTVQPWSARGLLKAHPLAVPENMHSLEGAAALQDDGRLHLAWCLTGALSALRLPAPAAPDRADGLWRHTCFEAFVGTAGSAGYTEWNFAPSGQWAAYVFDDYRRGMAKLALSAPPEMKWWRTPDQLRLDVALPPEALAGHGAPSLRLGLAAVIEGQSGDISYWALVHPGDKPDFHDPAGFVLGPEASGAGD